MAQATAKASNGALLERLKSAGELDLDRLPQLAPISKEWAGAAEEGLAGLVSASVRVTLAGMEVEDGAPRDGEGESLYAPIFVRRSPVDGFASFAAEDMDALIAFMFGGKAGDAEAGRALTDLDRSLVRIVMERFVLAGARALGRVVPVSLRLGEPGSRAALKANKAEEPAEVSGEDHPHRFAVFRFEIRSGENRAKLAVAFPESLLGMHRRALSEPLPAPKPDRDESWTAGIRENFVETDMRVEAVLARITVPLREVGALKPGQTLPLHIGPADAITLACEDRGLVRGHIGHAQGRYVLRVAERIHPDEEFIDGILSR